MANLSNDRRHRTFGRYRTHVASIILMASIGLIAARCERATTPAVPDHPMAKADRSPASLISPSPLAADTNGESTWPRPRSEERRDERLAMVRDQIASRGVDEPVVLAAMRHVPRHWFVPEPWRRSAYEDRALPIGEDQTISQPLIVAMMTAALNLTPNAKVLEVGTGSGYQAAVLSEITPHVYTIEIVEPLGRRAIATFKKRGYATIKCRIGDGYRGWPDFAPFDAIIVTCAPDHIPQPLVEQLAVGGRICIPVESDRGYQELLVVTKQQGGALKQTSLIPVRFVPMTGEAEKDRSRRE